MTANSPFSPVRIGPLTLRNRFIKAATNEGMSPKGIPSKSLVRLHESIAAGGTAMTTAAYCAVSPDGRTFVDQAVLSPQTVPHYRALTDAVHRHGAAACAQITHGGCFTFLRELDSGSPLSSSGGFNKVGVLSGKLFRRAMDQRDMSRVAGEFVRAARLAREAGFDAVEIHMGHGYLLSQFLTPLYNKRRDAYGGSVENRTRFPVEVLQRVLDAVGHEMGVLCKYSVIDGAKGGNTVEDGIAIARALEAAGAHMLVLSAGLNIEAITTMFGSPIPRDKMPRPDNRIVAIGMKLQALTEQKAAPFRELYSLGHARKVREAVRVPLAYLGGIQSLRNVQDAMAAGFDTVAVGRALLFDNAFVAHLQDRSVLQSGCNACNLCAVSMYSPGGTSCALHEPNDPVLNTQPAAA